MHLCFCSLVATVVTEKIIKSNGGIELLSVVKFCVALNKSPTETLRMIKSTGKYDKCSPGFVYKWHSHFRSGRESTEDNFRSGQLAVVTCSIKDLVKDMVNMDRRTTVRVIADELGVSCSTVHGILTEELKMCRYCRWLCWESAMIAGLKQRLTFCDVILTSACSRYLNHTYL